MSTEERTIRRDDGVTIWAERTGDPDRPHVLLMTGAAMQATTWESSFIEALVGSGRSVIRFDWRDIGRSTWRSFRESPYDIDTLVQDGFAVAEAFGAQQVDLVGFSMGGCMAQIAALSRREAVRSLTLVSSGYATRQDRSSERKSNARMQELQRALSGGRPESRAEMLDQQLAMWRAMCGSKCGFEEAVWLRRIDAWLERGQNPSCPHLRLGAEVFGNERSDDLRSLDVPALVVHGDNDPMFPLATNGEPLADVLAGARLEVRDGRGHDLIFTPDVGELVAEFLRSVPAG